VEVNDVDNWTATGSGFRKGAAMDRFIRVTAGAALLLVAMTVGAEQGKKLYRWVDSEGVVHFGDHVPPEYADTNRQILNQQGVAVGGEAGQKTPEQLSADKAAAERAAAERQARADSARRDQVLLDTYLSVEEIESLRDQRLELMTAQIKVTEGYLESLRQNLQKLQKEAAAFKPYSTEPDARPIDEKLAGELANTMDSILLYEKNLSEAKIKQGQLVAQFSADIARFKELTSE
jgi:hypothetical protein